ncbi:MAG: hypothetical protein ACT452_19550 [Microthrixaceae bacterium]
MGTEVEAAAPASAWRRTLLRAQLVHADDAELDWLIAEAGTREGAWHQLTQTMALLVPIVIYNVLVWSRIGGVLVGLLVGAGFVVVIVPLGLVFERRVDPRLRQARFRTLKRSPTPDDPTVPADAPKRRRIVRIKRALPPLYAALITATIAVPLLDGDEPPRGPALHGFDGIQVGEAMCLLDASSRLNLSATVINNTDDDYVITLRADVSTADNAYASEQDLLVPAKSSNTHFSTFTGLTAPAERCQLTQVDQRRVER